MFKETKNSKQNNGYIPILSTLAGALISLTPSARAENNRELESIVGIKNIPSTSSENKDNRYENYSFSSAFVSIKTDTNDNKIVDLELNHMGKNFIPLPKREIGDYAFEFGDYAFEFYNGTNIIGETFEFNLFGSKSYSRMSLTGIPVPDEANCMKVIYKNTESGEKEILKDLHINRFLEIPDIGNKGKDGEIFYWTIRDRLEREDRNVKSTVYCRDLRVNWKPKDSWSPLAILEPTSFNRGRYEFNFPISKFPTNSFELYLEANNGFTKHKSFTMNNTQIIPTKLRYKSKNK